ncbi:TPA: ABC transporter ATP-binding protein [Streptococcus suis]|nr:ABC transporter ATP-binding protein [Streptococcus suis]HEM5490578.1 ABC transporter ATP-binding protein [Streptococcus suis]
MKSILQCQNLTYFYKNDVGIKNINLELFTGQALGLVGESGSGKSTIAQLLCRLLTLQEGSITLFDKPFQSVSDKEFYRLVQYIPQNPQEFFHPKRRIKESLEEAIDNFKLFPGENKLDVLMRSISEVGLKESHLYQFPHQLSGGECQRASIARALLVNPSLIICDEVTSALDVTIQAEIMKLLGKIKEKHDAAFLFIGHDIALVSQFCEQIIVLKDGQVVEQADTLAMVRHPRSSYTKLLLEAYGNG